MRFLIFKLSMCLFFFYSVSGFGLEIYRFADSKCGFETGLIVDADEQNIFILSTEGVFRAIFRTNINHVLVYNIVNNPIAQVDLKGGLKELLRDIYMNDFDKPTLVGWPIQFIEDMVVFFDLQGKTNLIDRDKLLSIKPSNPNVNGLRTIANYTKMEFSLGQNLPECVRTATAAKDAEVVQPTRMLSDKITIHEFLSRYENGFRDLRRFQRRTKFYARPFLFEKESRVGIVISRSEYQQELPALMPLYLKWSSGRPYGHQSSVTIGSRPIENLPNVEPLFGASSDLKLHFFNASLAGNFMALAAGRSFMVSNASFFKSFYETFEEDDWAVLTHFNYFALTGMDYGSYSFSFGVFYPTFGIVGNDYLREILASKSALLSRIMYTTRSMRFRLLYSSSLLSSDEPSERDVAISNLTDLSGMAGSSDDLLKTMKHFRLKSYFVRSGIDLDLNSEIKVGVDEVFLKANYSEVLADVSRDLNFSQYTTASYVKHQFGGYVAVVGYLNLIYRLFDTKIGNEDLKKSNNTKYSASMAVEFML